MASKFSERGYPPELIEKARLSARQKVRDDLLAVQTPIQPDDADKEIEDIFLISTYQPGFDPLDQIVNPTGVFHNVTKPPKNCTTSAEYDMATEGLKTSGPSC